MAYLLASQSIIYGRPRMGSARIGGLDRAAFSVSNASCCYLVGTISSGLSHGTPLSFFSISCRG